MFTIVLSFVVFPKPTSLSHYVGGLIVFAGIALNVYAKVAGAPPSHARRR